MKVLFLSPVPPAGAGCRYRIAQYLPMLAARGIAADLSPFYSPNVFRLLYQRGHVGQKARGLVADSLRRLRTVLRAGRYDAVFIYREMFPVGPPVLEAWIHHLGVPLIFDFDDPIYLPPVGGNPLLNRLRTQRYLPKFLGWCAEVIVANERLAQYARGHARSVTVIPTAVDTAYFRPPSRAREATRVVIGWIGSHTTAPYLQPIGPALREIACRYPHVEVQVIGAGQAPFAPFPALQLRPWALERERAELQGFDIGIMPQSNDDWSEGKSGVKALLYMSVGIPVVASPVGPGSDLVRPGVNGLLASSPAEWTDALVRLVEDRALRQRLGAAGRALIEERYSLAGHAPRLVEVVERAAQTATPGRVARLGRRVPRVP